MVIACDAVLLVYYLIVLDTYFGYRRCWFDVCLCIMLVGVAFLGLVVSVVWLFCFCYCILVILWFVLYLVGGSVWGGWVLLVCLALWYNCYLGFVCVLR